MPSTDADPRLPDIDRKGLKILNETYWSSTGWRDYRKSSTADFEYAKQAGLMFDDTLLSHQDVVREVAKAIRDLDRHSVVDAFVVSLSLHRLDIRSALGSFAVLQQFPRHVSSEQRGQCQVCGAYFGPAKKDDLSLLNFERLKWGGVRHDDPVYASFDLKLFKQLPRVVPSLSEVNVLRALLKAVESAPSKTTSGAIEKHLKQVFKSTKPERDAVIAILGFCGVLATPAHPGFKDGFVQVANRELPGRHWCDMPYPACWWSRSDGIDAQAVEYWFGHLL